MKYSEEQLVKLAKDNVAELVRVLMEPGTSSVELTLGAEILGTEVKDENIVLPVFRRLLRHINSLVREGAVIGVLCFYTDKAPPSEILEKISQIAENDPSPMLKSFAKGTLEDFTEL